MTTNYDANPKLIKLLNESYAAENAAFERLNERINETPFYEYQNRLKQHREETISQQNRLSQIIFRLGGRPTDKKASLPELKPTMTTMLKKTIENTLESATRENRQNPLGEEMELIKIKEDIGIEGSEIIVYRTLIEIIRHIPEMEVDLIVPLLQHNLDEETIMYKWGMDNLPKMVGTLLPNIISVNNKQLHSI